MIKESKKAIKQKRYTCVNCDTYVQPTGSVFKRMIAQDPKFVLRIIYNLGWRELEVNGGECLGDWLCPKCAEPRHGEDWFY